MSSHVVVIDVPDLGPVHYHPTPGPPGHQGGREVRAGRPIPRWPNGEALDEPDARLARGFWAAHPELH